MRSYFQLVASTFLSLLLLASHAAAFDGKYRPYGTEGEDWDCLEVGMIGGAFQISGDQLTGLEYGCKLSNPRPANGLGATIFDGECAAEGTLYSSQLTLIPWEDGRTSGVYVIEDGYPQQWEACEQPAPTEMASPQSADAVQPQQTVSPEVAEMPAEDVLVGTSPYDGTYMIVVSRIWRDDYWAGSDNPYYNPGKPEQLSSATVRFENGQLELLNTSEVAPSGGPVFSAFSGDVTDDGVMEFEAWVNYMVGLPSPFLLRARFDLNGWRFNSDALVDTEQDFDNAYHAHISLVPLSGPRFIDEDASQSSAQIETEQADASAEVAERERLAAEQAERERLAAEQAEQDRLAAEEAERQRLAAEQAEREWLASEQAEQERLEFEHLALEETPSDGAAIEQVQNAPLTSEQVTATPALAQATKVEQPISNTELKIINSITLLGFGAIYLSAYSLIMRIHGVARRQVTKGVWVIGAAFFGVVGIAAAMASFSHEYVAYRVLEISGLVAKYILNI